MMYNPKAGDACRVWYAKKYRDMMPYHGMVGVVEVVCKARPRNHGVRLPSVPGKNGRTDIIAVPAGNLRALEPHCEHLIDARRADGGWVAAIAEVWESKTIDRLGRPVPGTHYMVHPLAGFRTVMGVHLSRAAAVDAAKTAIETWAMGMDPIGERIDYRDRRRVLPWHREAAERRANPRASAYGSDR